MPFGRGNKGRTTQRSHAAALQRMAQARSAGIARRISAAQRASVPHRISAPKRGTQNAKVNKVTQNAKVNKVLHVINERGNNRGTLRENQNQISISMINNKLDTLLELLKVDDPNTNIIMTFDQLNVRLDNLISRLKEKKKEEHRDRQAYSTRQDIQYAY